ncbi:MAG: alkyl hydroperoxide reductase subunit F [Defluviitaleaceae bacterium]|nr:alkyl hydroperoxide reductase subunit F [Defluviitaleaceae bacterium]
MLEQDIKNQLDDYLKLLEGDIVLQINADNSEDGQKVRDLVTEIADMSPKIFIEENAEIKSPGFAVAKKESPSRVFFSGLPLGHEFTSLVMAILQVSGRPPKIDQETVKRIKSIEKRLHFETYVSLSCHNCPDVVQALNIMSVLNTNISHNMIEGGMFKEEVEQRQIMAVPTVFLNGEHFAGGRMTIDDILNKVVGGASHQEEMSAKDPFDVLVVGAGPAGAAAAIYVARKKIRVGIVSENFGGQPLETLGIENFIGTKYTEGPKLAAQLEEHVKEYGVDIMKSQRAVALAKKDLIEISLANGAVLKSKTVILSTGARWRDLGVPGEREFKTKGIAYCPHCDGPLFQGKKVAVVGGGNSGVEAAIDLAGVVEHVTLIEFLPTLKADTVLQERLKTLKNVTVITNAQVTEIKGTNKVNGISYTKKETGENVALEVAGVFILIGLVPNTDWLKDTLELNEKKEIITDKHGATSVNGVFAAGDCTDSAYKQIVISIGSGATAALGAFDYLMRN